MKQESKLLLSLLRQEIAGQPGAIPENVDWSAFVRLARFHGLGAVAYAGLQKHSAVPEAVMQALFGDYHGSLYRDVQLDYVREAFGKGLTAAGVPHVFLKGICLKRDYPVPALRTMGDIDMLVRIADFPKLDQVAAELGATQSTGDGNHRNYQFPGGVLVECHQSLLHPATPVARGLNPGWQYTRPEEPGPEKTLTEEGFYLNVLCHMADHFVTGGVGVRFVVDVWVCRNLHRPQPDRQLVEQELKHFGLLGFARNVEALGEAWLGSGEMTPELEELEEYILTSGTHGTASRAMLNAVSLEPGRSGFSALWKKIFYPRQDLEGRYPWCRGKPWLLPAAWLCRVFRVVTQRRHLVSAWRKGVSAVSDREAKAQREKLRRFGIE